VVADEPAGWFDRVPQKEAVRRSSEPGVPMPQPRRSRPFGDLEASVMELLWDAQQPLLVRDVVDLMRPQRVLAYTTIMTVLDNLHRKGWLDRVRDGRAWRYSPVLGRQAYTATLMREALAVSDDRAGVLARFVEEMDPQDAAALADLLRSPGDRPAEGPPS
jgi:predicted transcriptional regulator